MRRTKRTTARGAKPAASCSPIVRSLAFSRTIGRRVSTSYNWSALVDSKHAYGHWLDEVKEAGSLHLYRRFRGVLRDTKHYALREITIRTYLKNHAVKKLQIGTGTNYLEGWLNTDRMPYSKRIAYLDVSRTFPFPDRTFDYVFTE